MEFNELNTNPPSTKAIFRQQVEMQTKECDFTVIMGTWSKRFHRSVLVGAEFFERLLDSTFQERMDGSVEMIVGGCPNNLESAIMFLYGVFPHITKENIGHLLDLAEFLVIPNLKAFLVGWLKCQTVTQDNFIQFLHLASLYELYLPDCDKYIPPNLNICFQKRDFVSLTKDSVIELLSDSRLIYAGSDTKFRFVLDWLRCRGPALSDVGREFIRLIDMENVSPDLIAEAQNDPVFQRCNIPIGKSWGQCPGRTVLLMKDDKLKDAFLGYDLDRSLWFHLKSAHVGQINTLQRDYSNSHKGSVIYGDQTTVTILDIESDSTTSTTLVHDEKDFTYSEYRYNNGVVWALFQTANTRLCSIFYMGILSTKDGATIMTPVLSFPFLLLGFYINESNTIGFRHNKKVYMFDANAYTLDVVPINEEQYGYRWLCPTTSGFVLYNDTCILDISRRVGLAVSSRYIVREINLRCNERYLYHYMENIWIRHDLRHNKYVEWVSHDDLKICTSMDDLPWQAMIPLPSRSICPVMADAVKVVLPRSKLTCHIECPHCKAVQMKKQDGNIKRLVDSTYPLRNYFNSIDYGGVFRMERNCPLANCCKVGGVLIIMIMIIVTLCAYNMIPANLIIFMCLAAGIYFIPE